MRPCVSRLIVANEGGHRPKESSRPRRGVDISHPYFNPCCSCQSSYACHRVVARRHSAHLIILPTHSRRLKPCLKKGAHTRNHFNIPPRVWLRDCVILRYLYALLVLVYVGSISAPDEANLREEAMPYNAPLQAHTMPFPPIYYVLVLCAALASTHLGSTGPFRRKQLQM